MHGSLRGKRQLPGTVTYCHAGMTGLILLHRLDDRPGFLIRLVQSLEVSLQMPLDLPFGLRQKPEAPLITELARGKTDGVRAGIPQGIEQAGAPPQFLDAPLTPGEVVFFFGSRLGQCRLECFVFRSERLALVERLRADLAAVIDAHQGGGMPALRLRQVRLGELIGRRRAARLGRPRKGAQAPVELDDQSIQQGVHGNAINRSDETAILGYSDTVPGSLSPYARLAGQQVVS